MPQKQNKRSRTNDVPLVFLESPDVSPAIAATFVDSIADRRWLRDHPEAETRVRQATSREIIAFNLLPGSTTVAMRGPLGSVARAFQDPPKS